jgi:chorismate dehydratase
MWDFHHPPRQSILSRRYDLHLTVPSQCAAQLLAGEADLGLIPIAALTPDLAIVPNCTIASLQKVRSIQLVVKSPLNLGDVKTVAADTASRSSVAYAEVIFRHFLHTDPTFVKAAPDLPAMLQIADAALLIGDPALLALEQREQIEQQAGPCTWYDLAELWNTRTGLPWVAAVWAVCPSAVPTSEDRQQLIDDLTSSRDHGLTHIEELVTEWTPRLALPSGTIRTYLTENIHYRLDERCIEAIRLFRTLAAATGVLPPLPTLPFLRP